MKSTRRVARSTGTSQTPTEEAVRWTEKPKTTRHIWTCITILGSIAMVAIYATPALAGKVTEINMGLTLAITFGGGGLLGGNYMQSKKGAKQREELIRLRGVNEILERELFDCKAALRDRP
jgi:hypothetical protein